jgi:hypothetical protein
MSKAKIYLLILLFWLCFHGDCSHKKRYHEPPANSAVRIIYIIQTLEASHKIGSPTYATIEDLLKEFPERINDYTRKVLTIRYHDYGYWFMLYLSEKKDAYCIYAWPNKYDEWGMPMTTNGTQLIFFTWRSDNNYKTNQFQTYYLNTNKYQGSNNPPPVDFAFSGKPFESEVDEKIWKWWEHEEGQNKSNEPNQK